MRPDRTTEFSRRMIDWPEPNEYPGVVECRGGWFAVDGPGQLGSGPWETEEEARRRLPAKEDCDEA